jgi:phosphoenolpyruvate---glycerone phosphotransferase subunit DhaL
LTITRDAVIGWLRAFAGAIAANKDRLTQLDSAIGDADHGVNMDRGFQAVLARLPAVAEQDIGAVFQSVGMTLISTVGGASGPLYGSLFIQMGKATAGQLELTLPAWADALAQGVDSVKRRGKAEVGDKTMLDCLVPALEALRTATASGASLSSALQQSERAAHQGMLETIPMVARKGRASYLGERSAGHQDPGATSAHLLLQAAAETWSSGEEPVVVTGSDHE